MLDRCDLTDVLIDVRLNGTSRDSSDAMSHRMSQQNGNDDPSTADYERNAGQEGSEDEDVYDSESTTGWSSSSDEDDNDDPHDTPSSEVEAQEEEETQEAQEARAAERMRVLEAAGLLVKSSQGDGLSPSHGGRPAEDLMLRRKTTVRRGPRPEAPARNRTAKKRVAKPERPLPAPPSRDAPEPERQRDEQMEDAYDRFTKIQSEMNNIRVSFSAQSSAGSASGSHDKPFPAPAAVESLRVTTPPPGSGTATPAAEPHPSETTPESRSSGRFSSFASSLRSKAGQLTASQPERRATPVISGPMSSVPDTPGLEGQSMRTPSSATTAPASATSSTWGSFVGSEALATLPDKERKRQEAIFELCQTEATHVRDLQTIIEVFYNSIEEQKLLDDKARMVIFANIEDVMIAAVSFLSDLEERQRTSRLYVDHIGDILSRHIPAMKV